MLFGPVARFGYAPFEVHSQFFDRGQLVAQLLCCFAADAGGMGGGLLQLAGYFAALQPHRAFECGAALIAQLLGQRTDPSGAIDLDHMDSRPHSIGQSRYCMIQLALRVIGKTGCILLHRVQTFAQGPQSGGMGSHSRVDAIVQSAQFVGGCDQNVLCRTHLA